MHHMPLPIKINNFFFMGSRGRPQVWEYPHELAVGARVRG